MRVVVDVVQPLRVEVGGAADEAVHLVPLGEEQLRQVAPVLPRDARDQRHLPRRREGARHRGGGLAVAAGGVAVGVRHLGGREGGVWPRVGCGVRSERRWEANLGREAGEAGSICRARVQSRRTGVLVHCDVQCNMRIDDFFLLLLFDFTTCQRNIGEYTIHWWFLNHNSLILMCFIS